MDPEDTEEEVLMDLKPSRRRFIKEYVGAAVWAIIGFVILYGNWTFPLQETLRRPELLGAAFFFSAAFLFTSYAEARRYVEHYIITNTAVYEDIGVFTDRHTDLPFMKLERCGVHRPFIEKIMGIGDVRVDSGRDFFIIKGVTNPNDVERLIERRMREVMGGGSVAAVND
ncbi:MAG: PH domain-containing protein [Candidatus Aenigmatarchaeota archaeon]